MNLALLFFLSVAVVSLTGAVGVVVSPRPVHSALFLLVNFVTLAAFFVTLGAQFLAAAQVIIYAGGIVILILFVLMLIGSERLGSRLGHRLWTPYVGLTAGLIMLVTMFYAFTAGSAVAPVGPPYQGAPKAVGFELFTRYILPFEMVAVLLLVALIGALVLARPRRDAAEPTATYSTGGGDE
ncbi:MAG: NADH-quinone oxidoreductase subunit J [Caldilineaceae bacterium]|jgi:NADH-quinone oxidoreductase subunit J